MPNTHVAGPDLSKDVLFTQVGGSRIPDPEPKTHVARAGYPRKVPNTHVAGPNLGMKVLFTHVASTWIPYPSPGDTRFKATTAYH